MKITVTSKQIPAEKSGKGWLKFAVVTVSALIIAAGIFIAVENALIAPIVLSGMAMVLVTMYAFMLMWFGKTTEKMRAVYRAYNDMGEAVNQLTSLTRDLHDVLITVIRLAEYAPSALDNVDNERGNTENAPETNVEEWSLPTDDTVIPFDRRDSTG